MSDSIDLGQVIMLKPGANNPATRPTLTDALIASVKRKAAEIHAVLSDAANEFGAGNITFANSFGAEDMVLTDI
ncbi:MAG: phosphoadenylyl-sulfate reductase, partial [Methylotenera sp.]